MNNANNKRQSKVVTTTVTSQLSAKQGKASRPAQGQGRRSKSRAARRRRRSGKSAPGIQGANTYLRTLIDPCHNIGVKVPDDTTFPTSTFQLTFIGILNTGSGGDSGGIYFAPSLFSPVVTANGTVPGSLLSTVSQNFAQRDAIVALYDSVRPVSACLDMEFIGPTNNDGGYWDTALVPRNTTLGTNVFAIENGVTNLDTFGLSHRSVRILWRPQDDEDNNFVKCNSSSRALYPCMVGVVSGLPSSSAYVRYRCTANFEGIPSAETANLVSVTPSPINLSMMQSALNYVSQMNPTTISNAIGTMGDMLKYGKMANDVRTLVTSRRPNARLEL